MAVVEARRRLVRCSQLLNGARGWPRWQFRPVPVRQTVTRKCTDSRNLACECRLHSRMQSRCP